MNQWLFLLIILIGLAAQGMDFKSDESAYELQSDNEEVLSISLGSSPESCSSLSSSPERSFAMLSEDTVKSYAFFFCHICDKKIQHEAVIDGVPSMNTDYIEHMKRKHRVCIDCGILYKRYVYFETLAGAVKHLQRHHTHPVPLIETAQKKPSTIVSRLSNEK